MNWKGRLKLYVGKEVTLKGNTWQSHNATNYAGCSVRVTDKNRIITEITEAHGYTWFRTRGKSNWVREDSIEGE